MAQHYTVKLAGKRYTLEELSIAEGREFRQRIEPIFEEHGQRIFELFAAEVEPVDGEGQPNLGSLDWAALAVEVGPLALKALGSIDAMIDLVFLAAPKDMRKDREKIEADAKLSELFPVFLKAVALNYPLASFRDAALDFWDEIMPGENGRVAGGEPGGEPETVEAIEKIGKPSSEPSTESTPKKKATPKATSDS